MTRVGTNCHYNKTSQSEGTYTYRVYANDTAGNLGASDSRTVTLDMTPASVVITIRKRDFKNGTITLNATVTDSLSGVNTVTYYTFLNGGNAGSCSPRWGSPWVSA